MSSLAKLPPPVAPPYTTNWLTSTAAEAWAARGDGGDPVASIFVQIRVAISNEKQSPVIEYLPVSPVAPPKRIALPLEM
jgi:hypothetical protein